jgi:tetratricopeptide (TPR) repeat protein
MRYHPPKQEFIDDRDFRVFSYCLEGEYLYHDMMLGTLLRFAGNDTTVILMSDHGFHPDHLRPSGMPREPAGPAIEHRQFGIFLAKGPGIRKDERIYGANLLDICPTLLHLFGLPVGEDMDGKVLTDIYEAEPPGIQRIPSWDEVKGDHDMHPADTQISAADSNAALQQLVDLGYIAKPNADRAKALEETVRELEYNLAQSFMDGGIYNQAVNLLERLYDAWPMEHRFGFKLVACYQSLGLTSDLRRLVATLIERRVEEANIAAATLNSFSLDDPEVQKAEKARFEEMSAEEKRKFSRERRELIAKARPNLFSLRYLEASADFTEKKYDDALAKLELLDKDYGARRNALILRGEICQRLKRWKESKAAFKEALRIDPESPGSLLGLARTALATKEYKAAARYARESIGLLFFQPGAYYIHGLAQYRLGCWDEAERAFLLCVYQAPLFSAAFRMLGEIARWHKRDSAKQAFYQVRVIESRRQLRELREQKAADVGAASAVSNQTCEIRPMPVLQPHPEALAGVAEQEIITVVSGLPRSGTSLMMQILEAAGLPPFTDNRRPADESNRRGYYEHEKIAGLLSNGDRSWIKEAKGSAIKVIAPLLAHLPRKVRRPSSDPESLHYRILFMERDMKEILQSQDTMLRRLGKSTATNGKAADIAKAYRQQERHAKDWCVSLGLHAMSVRFESLVHCPNEALPQIAAFVGAVKKLPVMRTCIDPGLHRIRNESAAINSKP